MNIVHGPTPLRDPGDVPIVPGASITTDLMSQTEKDNYIVTKQMVGSPNHIEVQ